MKVVVIDGTGLIGSQVVEKLDEVAVEDRCDVTATVLFLTAAATDLENRVVELRSEIADIDERIRGVANTLDRQQP